MMNTLTNAALALAALTFSTAAPALAAPSNAFLVAPGHRIGHTLLGSDGTRTLAALPKPYRSDVGMSQRYYVWTSPAAHGEPHTLFVHAVSNGALNVTPLSGLTLDTIRVTSPRYATKAGLHVGSTLAQIRHQFPQLRSANSDATLYDDKKRGIAFEFARRPDASTRAIAVMVHTPGKFYPVTARQVRAVLQEVP